MKTTKEFLNAYLAKRPLFLSLIRAKEAQLFQKYLPLEGPILDVGCGDGYFASVAIHRFSRIEDRLKPIRKPGRALIDVGLDVEDSRVEEARKLGVYKKIIVYDGLRMPFPKNSFGTVISNCVLEHIPDLSLTLSEIYRVLKPGGVFITTVATRNWEEYLLGNVIVGDLYKRWMRKKQVHINLLSDKGWRKEFENCGFGIKQMTGYLDKKAVRVIDLSHYLSFPSLLSYSLTGRWVFWQKTVSLWPTGVLSGIVEKDLPPRQAATIFFVLSK